MSDSPSAERSQAGADGEERRDFLSKLSLWTMRGGLAGAYGLFAFIAARFLYPARPARREWMFVTEADTLDVGDSLLYRGPSGETVNVARQKQDGSTDDFIALSSTCPHLGCSVQWEAQNNRFFCPCHNGEFDASGKGYAGPPGDAGLELPRYPLKIETGLLFIEMPVESLTADAKSSPRRTGAVVESVPGVHAAGHDPCLAGRRLTRRPDGSVA